MAGETLQDSIILHMLLSLIRQLLICQKGTGTLRPRFSRLARPSDFDRKIDCSQWIVNIET